MTFRRHWVMPNHETFQMRPVAKLLGRVLADKATIIDPFARNSGIAGEFTNDLNPATGANHHMKAEDFCRKLVADGVRADAVLFDPPYSPRQITECYQGAGLVAGMADTQSARMYCECRDLLSAILKPEGIAVSFGWNSVGFGKDRGFVMDELHLLCHGGAHNDTIIVVERKAGFFL